MKEVDIGVEDSAIDKIIAEIDYVGNGKINYTEFLAVTLSFQETISEEMLTRLFKRFDVDDTGYISKENLMDAFKRLGRSDITLEEVTQMISVHDIAKDGQVSFNEFKKIFEEDSGVTTLKLT
jgi:calcium-dependent protein kinase